MIQRASPASRGQRHGSPSVRGSSRGGIQKRGRAPTRIDKDGDLDMDGGAGRAKAGKGSSGASVPTGPRGATRGRGRDAVRGRGGLSRTSQQAILRGIGAQQANILESSLGTAGASLQVDGLASSKAASNSDGGLDSLLSFLERKASAIDSKSNRAVKIKKSQLMGDSVIITAIKEDIIELQKLDQFIFAGTTLHIKPCEPFEPGRLTRDSDRKGGSVAPSTQETKEKLKAILANRYDGNLKLLNLSSLTQDAGLVEMGLGSLDGKVTSKLFPALMVVCDGLFDSSQAKREAIVSVSLAGNALTTVTAVTSLAQTFPGIKNLDLSGNNLTDLKSLEAWRWKFRTLENLVLTSNPIELQSPNYKNEIMRWYPKLQILNGVAVRTAEEIAAAAQIDNSPIPISGPDFRDVAQVGENFIKQFLPLYDSNRASLLDILYDNQSIHSISINMSSPRDRENSTPVPAWAAYIPYSRNLTKITRIEARMSRQYHGLGAIKKVWNNLPATRHPDLATNFDKYMIECHPLPGLADPSGQSPRGVDGLILNIHGEFEEEVSPTEKGIRSFSRTFILSPGQPGGIPIRVISDMMTLRAHAPLALPKVDHSTQQIQQAPVQQIQQTQITQDDITRQLVEKTGMTPEYSVMCLTETGWDLEKAFVAFNANKDKLPTNAFLVNVGPTPAI